MSGVMYNQLHQLADVTAPDGALLGAVPHTAQGIKAGEDAISAYLLLDRDIEATQAARLRIARRVIVVAGGTPNISPIRRDGEPWEVTVRRHQWALGLAREDRPFTPREASREVGR